MARAAVLYNNLVPNGSLADPAGTALTAGAGNGGQISGAEPEKTVLRVVCGATGGNFTLLQGDYPPALASGQGDYVEALSSNASEWLGPFESGRFIQSDGTLIFETSQSMTVTAFLVPRST